MLKQCSKVLVRRGSRHAFFTGKPQVDGLDHAFLFRNYRASLAKWQTADPIGYPDGWNQLAYCGNSPLNGIDLFGASVISSFYDALNHYAYGNGEDAVISQGILLQVTGTDSFYDQVTYAIISILSSVSYDDYSGSFTLSGTIFWEQGDVLGRTSTRWDVTVNWCASSWEYLDEGKSKRRKVEGKGIVNLYTQDVWDFTAHANDPWWRTVFDEYAAGGCANIYSYIMTGSGGQAYSLSGSARLNIDHCVYQWQSIE